ncbi:MAG: hypothetical protein MK033_08660 [Candidatus Caenarcaniphilales bacterium]|nr:hypothetical protein [Candidatus Caenarcaniphilales bacterium]
MASKAALEVYINSLGVEIEGMKSKVEEVNTKVGNLEGTAIENRDTVSEG